MFIPEDKRNLVYILFFMYGVAAYMPWYTVGMASRYLRSNGKEGVITIVGIVIRLVNITFQTINMFVPKSFGSLSHRMLFSLGVQTFIMVFIGLMSLSESVQTSNVFSWMTIVANVVIHMAGGIYYSSAIGSAANMPMEYIQALCSGLYLGIVISAVSHITALYLGDESKLMTMIFFTTIIVIHIVCLFLAITLESNRNKFEIYYQNLTENESTDRNEDIIGNRYLYVFTQIYPQLLDLFLVFFVSYTIFSSINLVMKSSDNWISDKYFTSVFGFLIFESFTFVGTITANYIRYPTPDSMIWFTSGRLLFIPLFLFFDNSPQHIQRSLPVLIKSDAIYVAFNAILGITGGHLMTLSTMYAPKQVRPKYSRIAGMMSVFSLFFGNLFGFFFSSVIWNII